MKNENKESTGKITAEERKKLYQIKAIHEVLSNGYGDWDNAQSLYEIGYRKEKDTATDIVQMIYDFCKDYSNIQWYEIYNLIKKIAEKYGVELE